MSTDFDKLVHKLVKGKNQILGFHIMVQWIREIDDESNNLVDFVVDPNDPILDKWDKISQMYRGMGYTSDKFSGDKCSHRFYKWLEFYAKNYDKLVDKLTPEVQQTFDLLKIVHTLDLNQLFESDEWPYAVLQEIGQRADIEDYLNDLENRTFELQPKNRNNLESSSNTETDRYLSETVRQLIRGEEEIKFFHSIVKMIDPEAVYWKNAIKSWRAFSKTLQSFGYSRDICCPQRLKDVFYKWSQFYAQNYYKFNDDLEPKLQKIFDLMKIVHILNLEKMWTPGDSTLLLLQKISGESEIQEFVIEMKTKRLFVDEGEEQLLIVSKKEAQNQDLYETNWNEVFRNFEDMGLRKALLKGIHSYGLEKPSVIQQRAIVPCIRGRNVLAQAQSGTGKTATFVIAILQRIDTSSKECQALILTPTRELAQQIQKVVVVLGQHMSVKCGLCIGGTDVGNDVHTLRMGAQITVGTCGRICDMMERKALKPETIKIFVVDEADHMLSGKNKEKFDDVFQPLKAKTQVILMSATMPKDILALTKRFMKKQIRILVNDEELTLEGIKQFYVQTDNEFDKFEVFLDLYQTFQREQVFIYCNTREKVDWLTEQLHERGIIATHIHGELEQKDRNSILRGFRVGFCRLLLTSDLLGRGIDVQQVSLVVNYDLPTDWRTYIHRVGRGGRFGRKGIAISFVTNDEMQSLSALEKHYNTNIEELPENWS